MPSCSAITAASVPDGARGRVEPIGQRDQPLRNAVVDIAGQPATFELLGLDDLLDEVLVRPFADHQLAVQARLVHGTGDQLPDHQQQFDVPRSVNSRRSTVCTLSTPTRPPGSVSIGTETIDVKSDPRSDWNGMYRGSDSLSWVMTTGSRLLATQPDTPGCQRAARSFLSVPASNSGLAPASVQRAIRCLRRRARSRRR